MYSWGKQALFFSWYLCIFFSWYLCSISQNLSWFWLLDCSVSPSLSWKLHEVTYHVYLMHCIVPAHSKGSCVQRTSNTYLLNWLISLHSSTAVSCPNPCFPNSFSTKQSKKSYNVITSLSCSKLSSGLPVFSDDSHICMCCVFQLCLTPLFF